MLGIFTDGDLRRTLDKRIDIHTTAIGDVMTKNPTTANPDMLAVEGLNLMQDKNINALILCEDNNIVGGLNMDDLLNAGVM
jgi:arabinose-5-phosphate isomerase